MLYFSTESHVHCVRQLSSRPLHDLTCSGGEYSGFYTLSSHFPFFVWATEACEGTNTSRQSRESHVETRPTSRCVSPGTDSACSGPKPKGRLHSAHTGSMFPTTLWESPRSKIQRLIRRLQNTSSWSGQAVKQSAMIRSALEFFATAQSFRERSFESVK